MGTASRLVLYRYLSLSQPHEMMTHDDPQSCASERTSEGKYISRAPGPLINALESCAQTGAYTTPHTCQYLLPASALCSSTVGGQAGDSFVVEFCPGIF